MTSEAHCLDSRSAVSVKTRAKEIEARESGSPEVRNNLAGKPSSPPVDAGRGRNSPAQGSRYQSGNQVEQLPAPPSPVEGQRSRRSSEGDLFLHHPPRQLQPPPTPPPALRDKIRRGSLGRCDRLHGTPPTDQQQAPSSRPPLSISENRKGSCSIGASPPPLLNASPTVSGTSIFATFGGRGEVVTCTPPLGPPPTDFSASAIFSHSPRVPPKEQNAESSLDDIITAFEKIRDEFTLKEATGAEDLTTHSFRRESCPATEVGRHLGSHHHHPPDGRRSSDVLRSRSLGKSDRDEVFLSVRNCDVRKDDSRKPHHVQSIRSGVRSSSPSRWPQRSGSPGEPHRVESSNTRGRSIERNGSAAGRKLSDHSAGDANLGDECVSVYLQSPVRHSQGAVTPRHETDAPTYCSTLLFSPSKTKADCDSQPPPQRHVTTATIQLAPIKKVTSNQSHRENGQGTPVNVQTNACINAEKASAQWSNYVTTTSVSSREVSNHSNQRHQKTPPAVLPKSRRSLPHTVNGFDDVKYKPEAQNYASSGLPSTPPLHIECERTLESDHFRCEASVNFYSVTDTIVEKSQIKKDVVTTKTPNLYSKLQVSHPHTSETEVSGVDTIPNSTAVNQTTLSLNKPDNVQEYEDIDRNSPSKELEIVKSILANLDFEKYKRKPRVQPVQQGVEDMENKSPIPPRSPKTSTAKLKDLFSMLKPSSESANKRPLGICRSSSFSNAETLDIIQSPPKFFLGSEDSCNSNQTECKTSTLPRRKSSTHQTFTQLASPLVSSVSSCPSIVKLEPFICKTPAEGDLAETDPTHDEGLVSDSEAGPGAYVTAYVSCVNSDVNFDSSTRRGHVRSSSDNVTSSSKEQPEINVKCTGSTEKLSTMRTGTTEKRKRRKGIGSAITTIQRPGGVLVLEPAKSGTGRSLTYPPQRKGSTSEEESEYTSVDSNGLKSLKLLSAGLEGSHQDSLRLLSDLSLADSHLCPSEGTVDESYQDVVDSVMHSLNDVQHLTVEDRVATNGKSHKKKHHSDPGGEACCSASDPSTSSDPLSGMGSSKSEPDLGGNEVVTPSSASSYSSASSESSSRVKQEEERHRYQLMLVIEEQGSRGHQLTRHASGSFTSGVVSHSRFQFPDSDGSPHRQADSGGLSSSKSPQEQRRYSKRRLRGPYGEMLEEEMRKSGEKQLQHKPSADLSFLQDISNRTKSTSTSSAPESINCPSSDGKAGATGIEGSPQPSKSPRSAMFLSSQSLDDASSMAGKGDSSLCVTPRRKISANYPLLNETESALVNSAAAEALASSGENDAKDILIGLTDKVTAWASDTRTHVVGELYDTEKSYVESLQILANKYMKPLKSSEYTGVVETSLVDEIFFQIPEILSHHEEFLEALKIRLTSWDSKQKVGDVFVEAFTKQHVIDTYTAFINNWKSAKDAIKLASHAKPAFARFLEHMSREHKGKLTLDALLIMPVQRIPRYELLIKELLKHTHVDHPDHHLLIMAQKEVHDLALKINRMEREAFQQEQMQQRVREIEQLIDGVIDLVQPDRDFIRHDMVSMPGGLGTKKDRCLFLFSDVLLITSMKRRSGTMRKPSSTSTGSPNSFSSLEMNKYKLLTRFSLDNLDIAKSADVCQKKIVKDIEVLEEDVVLLSQINELTVKLNTQHPTLDDALNDLTSYLTKQLSEKQNADSQLSSLELTVTTQEGVDNLTFLFLSPEKRATWEAAFNDAKQKLALSTDRRPPPEFMHPLPIRKTRAGLQFTCATATLGLNQQGLRDVWVCNSDGYVGQVCVLSLLPEPTVMSCNGVCNARILAIASIPAACATHPEKSRWRSTPPDNTAGVSIEVEGVNEEFSEERTKNGNIQLDSDSSDDDDDTESTDDEKVKDEGRKRGNSIPRDDGQDDMDHKQPTMWLGTEDGCIHVYNCNDNIRTKKNKIKIQHGASITCIIYLDNRVFVSVANGEIYAYKKDSGGGWSGSDPQNITVGSTSSPVTRMLAVAGKLWCGCQNAVNVVNTSCLEVEHSFSVSSDATRTVLCMVTSGLGVWIALQQSAILRLFHATSYECLLDVNVAPAVTKMLSGCDDIIRQHKAACLRITAVLTCKDLLWVGTSAGVILTLPLPHLTSSTTALDNLPNVSGLPYGHTGHVRFLTCVEMSLGTSLDLPGYGKYPLRPARSKDGNAGGRRASTTANAGFKLLVISGGDGYEDFQNYGLSESAGRDDSTNHLLLWQV